MEGELVALVENKEGNGTQIQIKTGDFFGEIGLISGRRRTARIKAITDCVLIETPRRSMVRLVNSVESVQRKLDEVSLKRMVRNCLTYTLPEEELDYLVKTATIRRYENGEVLFHQGDKADGLYLIRRGSVTVSRMSGGKENVLSYVVAGNYVGEMALVSDKPRTATVRAAAPTEAIMLEAAVVTAVLERNETMRDILVASYRENVRHDNEIESQGQDNLIAFLMQQGVGEATDVLLIDYSLCIRCNNCEAACADTHGGTSLLDREAGPTHGYIHVPTSCRHCEHPHCMKDCPPDAIHRTVNGEVFISDSCIGCGNCKNNCPYGVIQMAAINPAFKKRNLWQILLGGCHFGQGETCP
ncbi:MAG: cyclic nucleotide-binding domain-containing protein [Gallionellaceae bacterium]